MIKDFFYFYYAVVSGQWTRSWYCVYFLTNMYDSYEFLPVNVNFVF